MATTEGSLTFSVDTTGNSFSIRGVSFFTVEKEKIFEKMFDSHQELKEGETGKERISEFLLLLLIWLSCIAYKQSLIKMLLDGYDI